jgi:serine/threonine protein kinase
MYHFYSPHPRRRLTQTFPLPLFSEMALLARSGAGARQASILCESDNVYCYVLSKRIFNLLLGPVREILIKISNERREDLNEFLHKKRKVMAALSSSTTTTTTTTTNEEKEIMESKLTEESVSNAVEKIEKLATRRSSLIQLRNPNKMSTFKVEEINNGFKNINLNDYIDVGKLGEGSFGSVRLVQNKTSQLYYALKVMAKDMIEETKQTKNVLREKKMLLLACRQKSNECNPSVVTLHGTCSDISYLYMLLDCIPGGELRSKILESKNNKMNTKDVQFYTGCIVSLLALLHLKSIAFRDLKPENLLIDGDGYIVVVDFGFAKIVKSKKTYTFCGSVEYLAPEIILRRGHDSSVDFWSLGIIIYEMIYGVTPFYSDSHRSIFKKILKGDVIFPKAGDGNTGTNDDRCNFIHSLLDQTPTTRLGCLLNGVGDIVDHPYFNGFDWNLLSKREMAPPSLPVLSEHGVVALESEDEEETASGDDDDKEEKVKSVTASWMKTWGIPGEGKEWENW